jgi:hypothetical protein
MASMDSGSVSLERFIPQYDVRERFETTIRAPADVVMDVAAHFDLQSQPVVKSIFWLRDKVTRAARAGPRKPQGILEETRALGWGLLPSGQAGSSFAVRPASPGWPTSASRPSPPTNSPRTPGATR